MAYRQGYRQCIHDVAVSYPGRDGQVGHRKPRRDVGGRCRRGVSPKEIAERGLPLCNGHWSVFCRDVAEDAARRKALRAKYDPGPLPLNEEVEVR